MPRFIPASLPFASKVANAGGSPVRTLLFVSLFRAVFPLVKTQNAFTFPAKENDHPLDICIVSWALATAGQSSATATDNSARRFIRKFLLGSLPAQTYRSCPARRRLCRAAPGTAEWEHGSPTSKTR